MSVEREAMSAEREAMSAEREAMSAEREAMSVEREAMNANTETECLLQNATEIDTKPVNAQSNACNENHWKSETKKDEGDPVFTRSNNGPEVTLHNPTSLPNASGYLWNKNMLLNLSCQGYANVHFMQPEPATYSCGPALEAKTFLQPEHQYYPGHPGRFFYFKSENNLDLFSIPYAPVNKPHEKFEFIVDVTHIGWKIKHLDWHIELSVCLPVDDVAELWELTITNHSEQTRTLSHYTCFNIGNQSWMNQSSHYDGDLYAIIADKVSPYQKTEDYQKQKNFLEKTLFASDLQPKSWTTNLKGFLGNGDWQSPVSVRQKSLSQQKAIYESPVAAMQFEQEYQPGQSKQSRFIFGPAKSRTHVQELINKYLRKDGFESGRIDYQQQFQSGVPEFSVQTPDSGFNHFVQHWLVRQVRYHGDTQRLTTDPQTRNYLQDAMGMCFIAPAKLKTALLRTLSQQSFDGEIPDGVLLNDTASLKYINQIPHSDHAIWLPLCLEVYFSETNDFAILEQQIPWSDNRESASIWQHMQKAMQSLLGNLDDRGLSLIHQGDWCDPMNMVGHKGIGVSCWLTMATSWAFQVWAAINQLIDKPEESRRWHMEAEKLNENINAHFWDGNWYARGITDDGRTFGTHKDVEGQIYLNPQSWGVLCGAASKQQQDQLHGSVGSLLRNQYGVAMLAPAYTQMQEDIGRLTQKYPGVAENGSIYCHALAFYIYALWKNGDADTAFELMSGLITNEQSCERHGQLPVFVPNYYRGAAELHPEYCGRSSRLFNTGTIAWLMRTIIEEMCGLKGTPEGLQISPKLPSSWEHFNASREFRGNKITIAVSRSAKVPEQQITVNGMPLVGEYLTFNEEPGEYDIEVLLPCTEPSSMETA